MTRLHHGDPILPGGFEVGSFELRADGSEVRLELHDGDRAVTICASGVLAYRFSLEEVYSGYVEGSLDTLLVLDNPPWDVRYRDEAGPRGDFVREASFHHLNIPDAGILELWAAEVSRR